MRVSSCRDCRRPVIWCKRADDPERFHPPLDVESGRLAFCVDANPESASGVNDTARLVYAYQQHVCSAGDLEARSGGVGTTVLAIDPASAHAAAIAWAQGTAGRSLQQTEEAPRATVETILSSDQDGADVPPDEPDEPDEPDAADELAGSDELAGPDEFAEPEDGADEPEPDSDDSPGVGDEPDSPPGAVQESRSRDSARDMELASEAHCPKCGAHAGKPCTSLVDFSTPVKTPHKPRKAAAARLRGTSRRARPAKPLTRTVAKKRA